MWGTGSTIILLVAAVGSAGLGWLVASRRHPGYVFAFSFLFLGIAGLLHASLPSLLFETGLTAEDPIALLSDHAQMNRIVAITSVAATAFALVAGTRALWTAPSSVPTTASHPSSPRAAEPR